MLASLKEIVEARRISRSFDRKVLVKNVFPSVLHQTPYLGQGRKALWIGCRRYTRPYYALIERKGAVVMTIDIDPSADTHGKAGAHVTGSATALSRYYDDDAFDVIFCNGVIGWGINSPDDRRRCYAEMRRVMKTDALLVLGWNTYKGPDPLLGLDVLESFAPREVPGFGSRMIVPSTTHVFDMLAPRA